MDLTFRDQRIALSRGLLSSPWHVRSFYGNFTEPLPMDVRASRGELPGGRRHTSQSTTYRAHPQVYTPIIDIGDEAYLQWLIDRRRR
jgi:hypothetical protein